MAENSPQNNSSATNSALQQKSGFKELESALPLLGEDFLNFPQELPPDTGILPALYNPRETSLALTSNRSTPVPRPVEREPMISAGTPMNSLPTNPEGSRPDAPPNLALLPPIQKPHPTDSSGPMELIQEDPEISGLVNLFNNQFNLFVRAWEAQNLRNMKMILTQAATTQDMIEDLVGGEETIRLCQDWIPRMELNDNNPSPAMIPHSNHQPMIATPTPEPTNFQHRTQEAGYQCPTLQSNPGTQAPPPQQQQPLRPEAPAYCSRHPHTLHCNSNSK
ncbi:hypothetical protein PTTG_26860 [Puccinia triticina 1-1 BBBD Race 1]|uniref:Uncharacterized protein n=1 Tax=Puccinia triticina (isolate 1-1 / race 1 (BBBD)) TaxID=630390 RepID=A0A180GR70_PUCT1|nr:hypothetical protein PTTG_26860 [Puccinia triticina 1-1 BBBD Race 1]